MAAATQNLTIRIAVIDGDKARKEMVLTGEAGQRALQKIKEASEPASKSLVLVDAVSQQVKHGMEGFAQEAGGVGTVLTRLGPIGLAVAAVLGGITLVLGESITKFKEAQQAINQFEASLRATDNAAGVTSGEIVELSNRLERVTLFKSEDILKAASALTSFGDIQGETFTRAITLSADLATRLGSDIPSAADLLGAALEKPEEGLGRLARKFSDLSPAQKAVIDGFVKQGDIAAAQAVILDHLESKVRGLAESQTKGLAGASHELSVAWDDLLKSFGKSLSETGVAESAINGLAHAIEGLQRSLAPTQQQVRDKLLSQIDELENHPNLGVKLDKWVFGESPSLVYYKGELKKIDDALAEQQAKDTEEKNKALAAADTAAAETRNNSLLKIQQDFSKKYKETTRSDRDKVIEEAEEAKKRVDALFKDNRNSDAAKKAYDSVDLAKRAQLTKLDEQAAKPALQLAEANRQVADSLRKRLAVESITDPRKKFVQNELSKLNDNATTKDKSQVEDAANQLFDQQALEKAAEKQKAAIQKINQEVLRTKPSFDVAKQALDDWKQNLLDDLGEAGEANEKYAQLVEQVYKVKLKDIYDKSQLDSDKWSDGAARALNRYSDDATNAAKNSERVFGNAATKIEDTLVDMVSTGEFSMKKLGDLVMSIEQDILRSFLRENITGPIAGALGKALGGSGGGASGGGSSSGIFGSFFDDIFSSFFHDGGVVGESMVARRSMPAHVFAGAPRLHSGLMPDEFPAILQKGETVLPKNKKANGGMNVTFNISTPNAQSFMDSQGQIMTKLATQMQRHKSRNG